MAFTTLLCATSHHAVAHPNDTTENQRGSASQCLDPSERIPDDERQTGKRLCSDCRIRFHVHAVVIGGMKDELCLTIEEIPHL